MLELYNNDLPVSLQQVRLDLCLQCLCIILYHITFMQHNMYHIISYIQCLSVHTYKAISLVHVDWNRSFLFTYSIKISHVILKKDVFCLFLGIWITIIWKISTPSLCCMLFKHACCILDTMLLSNVVSFKNFSMQKALSYFQTFILGYIKNPRCTAI